VEGHEESASTLCNLLDEIITDGKICTRRHGGLQWEVDRATGEPDVYVTFRSEGHDVYVRQEGRRAVVNSVPTNVITEGEIYVECR
jgi:hypothetical protein